MYFGTKEIKTIEGTLITFMGGNTLNISEENKELITDEPMDGSKLQTYWRAKVAKDVFATLVKHNVRLSDVQGIVQIVAEEAQNLYNTGVAKALGKENLDTLARTFGTADEVVPALSIHNIRLSDITI